MFDTTSCMPPEDVVGLHAFLNARIADGSFREGELGRVETPA